MQVPIASKPRKLNQEVHMTNLQHFDQDGLELIINTQTGEAFTTAAGYSRMSGKAYSTIKSRVQSLDDSTGVQQAEILTSSGLQTGRLIPAKLVFKWAIKDNPELAEKMGEVGATVYLHKLAGYEVKSTAVESQPETQQIPQLPQRDPIEYIEAAEKLERINNLTLQQLLRDELIDHLHIKQSKKALTGETKKPEYTIAKVRARELGYNLAEVGSGSTLGKFIAKHMPAAFIERVGKYDVKHYEITDKLDALIHNYFALKANLA